MASCSCSCACASLLLGLCPARIDDCMHLRCPTLPGRSLVGLYLDYAVNSINVLDCSFEGKLGLGLVVNTGSVVRVEGVASALRGVVRVEGVTVARRKATPLRTWEGQRCAAQRPHR